MASCYRRGCYFSFFFFFFTPTDSRKTTQTADAQIGNAVETIQHVRRTCGSYFPLQPHMLKNKHACQWNTLGTKTAANYAVTLNTKSHNNAIRLHILPIDFRRGPFFFLCQPHTAHFDAIKHVDSWCGLAVWSAAFRRGRPRATCESVNAERPSGAAQQAVPRTPHPPPWPWSSATLALASREEGKAQKGDHTRTRRDTCAHLDDSSAHTNMCGDTHMSRLPLIPRTHTHAHACTKLGGLADSKRGVITLQPDVQEVEKSLRCCQAAGLQSPASRLHVGSQRPECAECEPLVSVVLTK